MMKQQFLFFDIDGTLYLPWLGLSQKIKDALISARANGHKLFLCTGRSLIGIPPEIQEIGFDGIIGSGGASIQLGDEVVYQKCIAPDVLEKLLEQLRQMGIAYELETNQGTFYSEEMVQLCQKYAGDKSGNSEMARLTSGKDLSLMRLMTDFYTNPVGVPKAAFLSESPNPVKQLQEALPKSLRLIVFGTAQDGATNGEIVPDDVNKGDAIRRVCSLLSHDLQNTIGFGDSFNDLEMLETCAQAVVMETADEAVKSHATHICPSVEKDGVYYAMTDLNLCDSL